MRITRRTVRIAVLAMLLTTIASYSRALPAQEATPPATPAGEGDRCASSVATGDGTPVAEVDLDPATLDLDVLYIDILIPHHEVAIEMARVAQARSTRTEVVSLAAEIIEGRTRELAQMRAWREAWYADVPALSEAQLFAGVEAKVSSPGRGGAPGLSELSRAGMDDALRGLCDETGEIELAVINALVEHQTGAVLISQLVADLAIHPEVRQLALEIADAQGAQIARLLEWRDLWYGGVPLDDEPAPDETPAT